MSEKSRSTSSMWGSIRSLNMFQTFHDYLPLNSSPKVSLSARYRTVIRVSIALVIVILSAIIITPLHPVTTARKYGILADNNPIPSIVHFVYIRKSPASQINFPFSAFLAVFASILYIKPTKVYIHTDYNRSEIQNATLRGGHWTRKLMNTWPELIEWDLVTVPNFAGPNQDQRINAIQHKSDFIRWDTIAETGGIYMDLDVVTLKPLTPLLHSGFAFIAGRQYGGKDEDGRINGTINNGVFLTKPNSAMAAIIKREQHAGFNGAWEVNLRSMTRTAEYLVNIPNQVLILDRHAFAPTHWFPDSTDPLFIPHRGPPSPEPSKNNAIDSIEMYDLVVKNRRARREWEMDFSATYMLHAFQTSRYQEYINPRTILSRTSNYGVATYPIVKAMVAQGLIAGTEDEDFEDF